MFALKSGTLAVVLAGERAAPDPATMSFDTDSFGAASVFSLDAVYRGVGRFWRRAVTMALGLGVAYFVIGGAYVTVVPRARDLPECLRGRLSCSSPRAPPWF